VKFRDVEFNQPTVLDS